MGACCSAQQGPYDGASAPSTKLKSKGRKFKPGEKFLDHEFPAESSTLMIDGGKDTSVDLFPDEIALLAKLKFKRLSETDDFSHKKMAIFNDIGPDDINQG